MATRVSETIYYVHDLDTAVDFYRRQFGFQLLDKQDWGWALFEVAGGAKLGLLTEAVWRQAGADYDGMPAPRLAFRTDEIEAEIDRLRSRGVDVDELKGEPGKMRAVTYRDCCGNEFFLWDDGSKLED